MKKSKKFIIFICVICLFITSLLSLVGCNKESNYMDNLEGFGYKVYAFSTKEVLAMNNQLDNLGSANEEKDYKTIARFIACLKLDYMNSNVVDTIISAVNPYNNNDSIQIFVCSSISNAKKNIEFAKPHAASDSDTTFVREGKYIFWGNTKAYNCCKFSK